MSIPAEELGPTLTVIEGGRTWRQDEAHIEAIAFMHEAIASAMRIVDHLIGSPIPDAFAINEATKLAAKATKARAEIIALTPDPSAA